MLKAVDCRPAQSTHAARDSKPPLGTSLRRRAGAHSQRFRISGRLAVPSGTAGLAGGTTRASGRWPSRGASSEYSGLIVTSAAYRQSSRSVPQAATDRRRQSPSMAASASAAGSGSLSRRRLGGIGRDRSAHGRARIPRFQSLQCRRQRNLHRLRRGGGDFNRRSLYRTWLRTGTSPLLDLLDCPDPSVATPTANGDQHAVAGTGAAQQPFHGTPCRAVRRPTQARSRPRNRGPGSPCATTWLSPASPPTTELAFGQRFAAEHGLTQLCLVLLNTSEFSYID